jgi:elongator complex protein 6
MASRIPPLLEPYLAIPPEASLILLTSVLGASTNWLVLRYLYSALVPATGAGTGIDRGRDIESGIGDGGVGGTGETGNGDAGGDRKGKGDGGGGGEGAAVVLVSFLRDLSFWREGGRRLVSPWQLFG